MQAEILSIGDELLIGQIVNTNASFIAKKLDETGIAVQRIVALGDDGEKITNQLKDSLSKADIVITTGGLGPTHDDITKKVIADFLGKSLVYDEEAYKRCKSIFDKRGIQMPKSNASQSEVIEGALVIQNKKGTAPGMIVHDIKAYPGKYVVILPGVPYEMQEMINTGIIEYFKPKVTWKFRHTVLMTAGIGESTLAEQIGDVNQFLEPDTSLAYLPHSAGVRLRLSTKEKDEAVLNRHHELALEVLKQKLGSYLYAITDMPLEAYIGSLLKERNLKLAVAESCTGGLIAHRITNIPGSSAYFLEGIVSYSNASKIKRLGVPEELIEKHGAVSQQVAIEMAKGCLETSGADIAIATTGIAGPGGETDTKPVGFVCFGLATSTKLGNQCFAKTMNFSHERIRNKERFSETALNIVRQILCGTDL